MVVVEHAYSRRDYIDLAELRRSALVGQFGKPLLKQSKKGFQKAREYTHKSCFSSLTVKDQTDNFMVKKSYSCCLF